MILYTCMGLSIDEIDQMRERVLLLGEPGYF